mmetsp:Transcript_56423/g.175470  ORF Transcript_56423/g.175470 Transcript_56423/m.175470 type:complete len:390 (+) Transcript_56423:793-1962(+)
MPRRRNWFRLCQGRHRVLPSEGARRRALLEGLLELPSAVCARTHPLDCRHHRRCLGSHPDPVGLPSEETQVLLAEAREAGGGVHPGARSEEATGACFVELLLQGCLRAAPLRGDGRGGDVPDAERAGLRGHLGLERGEGQDASALQAAHTESRWQRGVGRAILLCRPWRGGRRHAVPGASRRHGLRPAEPRAPGGVPPAPSGGPPAGGGVRFRVPAGEVRPVRMFPGHLPPAGSGGEGRCFWRRGGAVPRGAKAPPPGAGVLPAPAEGLPGRRESPGDSRRARLLHEGAPRGSAGRDAAAVRRPRDAAGPARDGGRPGVPPELASAAALPRVRMPTPGRGHACSADLVAWEFRFDRGGSKLVCEPDRSLAWRLSRSAGGCALMVRLPRV